MAEPADQLENLRVLEGERWRDEPRKGNEAARYETLTELASDLIGIHAPEDLVFLVGLPPGEEYVKLQGDIMRVVGYQYRLGRGLVPAPRSVEMN